MPTSKKRPKSFTFTLSKKEYETLRLLAARDGRSMANYLRQLIKVTDKKRIRRLQGRIGP